MKNIFLFIIGMGGMFLVSCYDPATQKVEYKSASPTGKINEIRFDPTINSIDKIPLPKGYKRVEVPSHSFGGWLRNIPLKEINKIYLYNGQLKDNQAMHFAVMDISTGDKDLQQCADALMRLRAEYLFSKNAFDQINFVTGNGTPFRFTEFAMGERFALRGQRLQKYYTFTDLSCYTHPCLIKFLNTVFAYCSTYSLVMQSSQLSSIQEIQPGDMLVKAGSPGHAMMVGDVATQTTTGKKIYLLIQSFMPAQDMHIVINPARPSFGPWYEIEDDIQMVVTPGYTFANYHFRRWKP